MMSWMSAFSCAVSRHIVLPSHLTISWSVMWILRLIEPPYPHDAHAIGLLGISAPFPESLVECRLEFVEVLPRVRDVIFGWQVADEDLLVVGNIRASFELKIGPCERVAFI